MYGDPFLSGYEQAYTIHGGGYEWAELRVFRKDGRLFYATGAGCSCTCYEDQVEESDLVELQSLPSAQNAVREFLDSNSWYFEGDSVSEYLNAVEKFRELGLR